jgi:hypothetical protein
MPKPPALLGRVPLGEGVKMKRTLWLSEMPLWFAVSHAAEAAAKVASQYAEDADYLTQHFFTGIVHGWGC